MDHNACRHGYNVRYCRLSQRLLELTQARADGNYPQRLKQLAKVPLLIIDDWELEPLQPAHRYLFVAIDRATRWVYLHIYADQSEASSKPFLCRLNLKPCKSGKKHTHVYL